MKIRYKLTNQDNTTRNNTLWGEGVTHTTNGAGELCGPGWLHVYTHPKLAILLNPIHGSFENPKLWECEVSGKSKTNNGLKEGWTEVRTVREIKIPKITKTQRIKFAIICAKAVCKDKFWNKWADKWLSGEDRSSKAADAARATAYAAADYAAADYAANAAAYAAAYAAADAAYAADAAAAYAVKANTKLDLIKIVGKL